MRCRASSCSPTCRSIRQCLVLHLAVGSLTRSMIRRKYAELELIDTFADKGKYRKKRRRRRGEGVGRSSFQPSRPPQQTLKNNRLVYSIFIPSILHPSLLAARHQSQAHTSVSFHTDGQTITSQRIKMQIFKLYCRECG